MENNAATRLANADVLLPSETLTSESLTNTLFANIPLTDVQMGIWIADQISSIRNSFTIAHKVHIQGSLNAPYLLEAIEIGLQEADTVNATYAVKESDEQENTKEKNGENKGNELDGIPTQTLKSNDFKLSSEWHDLTKIVDDQNQMNAIIQQDLDAELVLSSSVPLVRHILFKVSDQEYVWYQRFHHIMLDGFSFNVFTSRVAAIYQSLVQQKSLPKMPYTPFCDVVNEEASYKKSEKYHLDKRFWQTYCADIPSVVSLSEKKALGNVALIENSVIDGSSQRLIRLNNSIDCAKLQECLNLSNSSNLTIADLAIGLVSAYLIRISGQWRVPVGFPFMGRVGSASLNALGPVVNVLPMIVEGRFEDNVFDLTRRIKRELKTIRKHQKYNGEQISRDLNRVGEALYGPTLNLRLFDYELSFDGLSAKIEHLAAGPVDDLDFGIHFDKDTLHIEWVANSEKYDITSLGQQVDRFNHFIQALLSRPNSSLAEIPALLLFEQLQIQDWQQGRLVTDNKYTSLIEQFHGLDLSLSSVPALVVKNQIISFAELRSNISKWAQVFSDLGIEKGACVGLALPRDERMVYAMFATMSLGAHYLPIDPTYPKERIHWMLEDAKPQLLITDGRHLFDVSDDTLICSVEGEPFINALYQKAMSMPKFDFPAKKDLAYIMYTSGSTGKAKGVAIAHEGLVNLALSHWSRDGKALADKHQKVNAMLTASFSFDTSWDILYWLCFGHTLHIVEDDVCKDPELIQDYCDQHKIHATDLPPTVLTQLFDLNAVTSGRHFPELVYIGGEAASSRLWQQARLYPKLNVRNYYGPTENTVDSLGADVLDSERVIIGRPIANTEAYILDASLSPVVIGVTGELYVSGPGLAHGYLNQLALTATRFIANPFKAGERMYRTGDLARWLENGQVEFIGRTDHQVQIRGYRVEPGEVEAALNALEGIRNSIVIANKQGSTHRLDAYVVVEENKIKDDGKKKNATQEFMKALSCQLPAYMVPATLTLLAQFPLNTNGKIDRTALPSPVAMRRQGTLPKNDKETLMCQLVQQVLNLDSVFVDDDFFALGGDSIVAMSLGGLARKAGYSLRAKDVFESRIVRVMASKLISLSTSLENSKNFPSIQSGQLSELPIYHWMKEAGGLDLPYYQGICIALPSTITLPKFDQLIAKLATTHTLLKARVFPSYLDVSEHSGMPSVIQTFIQNGSFPYFIDTVFDELIKTDQSEAFQAMRVGYLHGDKQSAAVIALHHTIVDGVSWRILFSDLSNLLQDINSELETVPNSLFDWQKTVQGKLPQWRLEAPYWQEQSQAKPLFELTASNERKHQRTLLDKNTSALLLDILPSQYRCQPQEALLSVLYIALAQHYKTTDIPIMMESHGRTDIDGLDLNRTLGWFTAEYPVRMRSPIRFLSKLNRPEAPYEAVVQLVRSALLKVPNNGIGHGVLQYLDQNANEEIVNRNNGAVPQILFNYLGRFQQDSLTLLKGERYFHDTFEVHQPEQLNTTYALELNVFIDDSQGVPQLAVHVGHDERVNAKEIKSLLGALSNTATRMTQFAEKHQAIAADTLVSEDLKNMELSEHSIQGLRGQYGALQAILPALPLQEGLLFHVQLEQDTHAKDAGYSSLARLTFSGKMDIDRLKSSLGAVIEKHPQLGALFDFSQSDTALQILPWRRVSERRNWWPIQVIDLSNKEENDHQDYLNKIERDELSRDFMALQSAGVPLLHATLVTLSSQKHCLFLNAHHLVIDGWSTPIMLRDLVSAYASPSVALAPVSVPYTSVVNQLIARDKGDMRAAWNEALVGAEPTLLFADNPPAELVTTHTLTLNSDQFSRLKALYQSKGLTLNSVLQTLWANLLFGLTGRSDVIFGTPISGRFSNVVGIEEHIGLFSNTVPVRVSLQPELTLWEQMKQVQNEQISLLEYDGLGLSEIQRLGGHNTLFDTLLVVENFPEQASLFDHDYHGLTLEEVYNRGFTHYPLTVLALPSEQLDLLFEYRGGDEIQRLMARFEALVSALLAEELMPQHALDFRSASEKTLISDLNETAHSVPNLTLRDRLIQQALLTPEHVCLSDENVKLTYLQTRYEVIKLAKELQLLGVQSGDLVAVALPRSVKLSLALWAIIEVGAAYLPLDTGYPDDRLNYMLEDAKPRVLISLASEKQRFENSGKLYLYDEPILPPDDRTFNKTIQSINDWEVPTLNEKDAAYLLYTSGSTGRPKGVLVSHQAIVNRILWMQELYPLTSDDVVLQKTPCSFDVSVWEFFWSAMVGAQLYMAPPEFHRDPVQLQQLIIDQKITTIHFVPSMLAAYVASLNHDHIQTSQCDSLKRVFCSGEALPVELSKQFEETVGCELHNLYGPTEAAVDVTYYPAFAESLSQAKGNGVPIGYPVWNTQVRILDDFLRPVPVGVAGELYLCGVQLADGYWRRPELCATRFVADVEGNGSRMYRTGDVVRWLDNGAIEYLGRSDDQLKIRGQRIELGEIEQVLAAQVGVEQSVVVAKTLGQESISSMGADARQLVAYVTSHIGELDTAEIRQSMAGQLPAHMVPVAVLQLEEMPLSANGKLDRKALPLPSDIVNSNQGRAIKLGVETEIANAFAKVLGVTGLTASDDFFSLGGHSILAVRLVSELRRTLKQNVTVGQVMVSPSIEKLAHVIGNQDLASNAELSGFGAVLPIKQGLGTPIFCVHSASGFAWQYTGFARYLDQSCPMIGLQSPRPDGPIASQKNMTDVVEQHLNVLKERQPSGPYQIIGYSLGGVIAHGLAVRLQEMGEEVNFLGLLDTYPPDEQDWSGSTETEAQEEVEREKAQFMATSEDSLDDAADTSLEKAMQAERDTMFADIVKNYADSVTLLSTAKSKHYRGKAVLFVADKTLPENMDIQATWAPYVDSLEEHHFDFAHEDILSPEALVALGPVFNKLVSEL